MKGIRLPAVRAVDVNYGLAAFRLPHQAVDVWTEMRTRSKSGYFQVHILQPFRPRTTGKRSQNNCEHGWLSWICQFTGYDFHDLELLLLRRAFRRGYPPLRNSKGEIVYSLNDKQALPKPFKETSIEEANLALAEIEQTAAELNINLPRYDEEGGLIIT